MQGTAAVQLALPDMPVLTACYSAKLCRTGWPAAKQEQQQRCPQQQQGTWSGVSWKLGCAIWLLSRSATYCRVSSGCRSVSVFICTQPASSAIGLCQEAFLGGSSKPAVVEQS